jgi:cleavage and polyadenylation specificity factor subunit 1
MYIYTYHFVDVQSLSGQRLVRKGDYHTGQSISKFVRLGSLPVESKADKDIMGEKESPETETDLSQFCIYGRVTKGALIEAVILTNVLGTNEGSLCVVHPLTEKEYKRMLILQGQLTNGIQHPGGLNPKAFRYTFRLHHVYFLSQLQSFLKCRLLNSNERLASNPVKSMLDGDLLYQFLGLGTSQQKEITKQIGTISVDRVLDDFTKLARSVDYF